MMHLKGANCLNQHKRICGPQTAISLGREIGPSIGSKSMLSFMNLLCDQEVTGLSFENSLCQKCKVRLHTICPCSGTLFRTRRIAKMLVRRIALTPKCRQMVHLVLLLTSTKVEINRARDLEAIIRMKLLFSRGIIMSDAPLVT